MEYTNEELKAVRWRQRFENLEKAAALFLEAVAGKNLNRLEQEGMIQRFEYTFELCWKTLKDFLESRGLTVAYPRDAIKEAFRAGLLSDGETWLEMLEGRNGLSHTYNEERFREAVEKLSSRYAPAVRDLVERLRSEKDL